MPQMGKTAQGFILKILFAKRQIIKIKLINSNFYSVLMTKVSLLL